MRIRGLKYRLHRWARRWAFHWADAVITCAESVRQRLVNAGLSTEIDLRNEKINYKVREHSLAKVPVLLVIGKREADEETVSMRRLGSQKQTVMSVDDAVSALAAEAVPPDVRRAN